MKKTGVIQDVGSRSVNTKFGVRSTHNITVDGEVYQLGFGKFTVVAGNTVEFDFEETKYGKEIVKGTLQVVGGAAVVVAIPAAAPAPEVVATGGEADTRYVPKS